MAREQCVGQYQYVCFVIDFGGCIFKRVGLSVRPLQSISAKEGPEIDHEHNRDNPNSWSLDVTSHTLYDHEWCS